MSNIGKKVNQIKKILNLIGINSLTDYTTKVFLCDLKEKDNLIKDFNKITNQNISTVEGIVKYLKDDLFDQCGVKYVSGRTSKSTYFSLCDATEHDYALIGDFLFYKSIQRDHTLLMSLCIDVTELPKTYSSEYCYLMPESSSSETGIIYLNNGKRTYDYYSELFIIVQYDSNIKNMDEIIDYVKEGNTEYNKKNFNKISRDQVIYCYESKSNNISLFENISFKLNTKHPNYDNIELITLAGKCVFFDHLTRKALKFSPSYESIPSSISAKHIFDLEKNSGSNNIVSIVNPPFCAIKSIFVDSEILPKNIKIIQNGGQYCIDAHLIDCINISNSVDQCPKKGFELPFYDAKIGNSYKSPKRTDNFQIIVDFGNDIEDSKKRKGTIWFETYDNYIYYNWLKDKIRSGGYVILNINTLENLPADETIYFVNPNNDRVVHSNLPYDRPLQKYKSDIKFDYEFDWSSEDDNEYVNLYIKNTKYISFFAYKSSINDFNVLKNMIDKEYLIIFQK
jgi:hypothetical protein